MKRGRLHFVFVMVLFVFVMVLSVFVIVLSVFVMVLPVSVILLFVFGMMLFNAPRIFATAWDSFLVQLDKAEIRIDILTERVRQLMLERTDKSLFVRGDGAVTYKDIVYVFDRLKEAGVEKVGLVTVPLGKK